MYGTHYGVGQHMAALRPPQIAGALKVCGFRVWNTEADLGMPPTCYPYNGSVVIVLKYCISHHENLTDGMGSIDQ